MAVEPSKAKRIKDDWTRTATSGCQYMVVVVVVVLDIDRRVFAVSLSSPCRSGVVRIPSVKKVEVCMYLYVVVRWRGGGLYYYMRPPGFVGRSFCLSTNNKKRTKKQGQRVVAHRPHGHGHASIDLSFVLLELQVTEYTTRAVHTESRETIRVDASPRWTRRQSGEPKVIFDLLVQNTPIHHTTGHGLAYDSGW